MNLIACYLAGNCEQYMDMSLESIEGHVDKTIVVYDTSSKDNTHQKLLEWQKKIGEDNFIILKREYEHDVKCLNANSNARNFYLQYLQENYKNDFCLVLDMDEVANEPIKDLKKMLKKHNKKNTCFLFSIKMEHFIQNLSHVDNTVSEHFVKNRLFKIIDGLYYPDGVHTVLNYTGDYKLFYGEIDFVILYHVAYINALFDVKRRYLSNVNRSNIHDKHYLDWWYFSLLTGEYPTRHVNITTLPEPIKKAFKIKDEYFYFKDSKVEHKHWLEVLAWSNFLLEQNELVTFGFLGAGLGHRVFVANSLGFTAHGYDLPKVIDMCPYEGLKSAGSMLDIDLNEYQNIISHRYKMVVAYDVLEHIEYENLHRTLSLMNRMTEKYILISVPVLGDYNLENDPTHIIKESSEWWKNEIQEAGFKLIETPQTFLFRNQLILGEKIESSKINK